jgi:hypothetical protein
LHQHPLQTIARYSPFVGGNDDAIGHPRSLPQNRTTRQYWVPSQADMGSLKKADIPPGGRTKPEGDHACH